MQFNPSRAEINKTANNLLIHLLKQINVFSIKFNNEITKRVNSTNRSIQNILTEIEGKVYKYRGIIDTTK